MDEQIAEVERELAQQLKAGESSRRLLEIPGIGPIIACAQSIELGDSRQFGSRRQFAASLGLVPRQYSTGGKPMLLGISKRGTRTLGASAGAERPCHHATH